MLFAASGATRTSLSRELDELDHLAGGRACGSREGPARGLYLADLDPRRGTTKPIPPSILAEVVEKLRRLGEF